MIKSNRRKVTAALVLSAGISAGGSVQGAKALDAHQREAMSQSLEALKHSRDAMASMITECNGGTIMIIVCPPPSTRNRPPDQCTEPNVPCSVVTAFHATEAAIADLKKALAR